MTSSSTFDDLMKNVSLIRLGVSVNGFFRKLLKTELSLLFTTFILPASKVCKAVLTGKGKRLLKLFYCPRFSAPELLGLFLGLLFNRKVSVVSFLPMPFSANFCSIVTSEEKDFSRNFSLSAPFSLETTLKLDCISR